MRLFFLLFLAGLAAAPASAQAPPDCVVSFTLSAVGNSAVYDNRTRGCDTWAVAYSAFGFTALDLEFQSAPNNAGVPGVWAPFAGLVISGVNPNVALDQASTQFQGYYPFLRVRLTAFTDPGGLQGTFYGWRVGAAGGAGVLGTVNQGNPNAGGVLSWPVQGPEADTAPFTLNPFVMAGVDSLGAVYAAQVGPFGLQVENQPYSVSVTPGDAYPNLDMPLAKAADTVEYFQRSIPMVFNGAAWDRMRGSTAGNLQAGLGSGGPGGVIASETVCDQQAPVSLSGAGDTEVVALIAARSIRVCHFSASFVSSVNLKFTTGTGVNCATGPADVSGVYQGVLAPALDFGGRSTMRVPAGQALCVNLSAAVAGGGLIIYAVY